MSGHVHLYDVRVEGEDPDFVTTWTCRCGAIITKAGLPTSTEGADLTIRPGELNRDDI